VYEGSAGLFTCQDKSKSIPVASINDDFCDCPDGSDEPGTSACSNGRFFCANKGFRGKYLPSSLVADGVCDCCDGSDETNSPKSKCRNTCEVDGSAWRAAQAAAIRKAEEGARLRKPLVQAGQAAASARAGKMSQLKARLGVATRNVESAQAVADSTAAADALVTEEARAAAEAAGGLPAVEKALGVAGLDREARLRLLLEHAKASNSQPALLELLKGKAAAGSLAGERRAACSALPAHSPTP
jgi:protein kinase C substrate 80K-H